MIRQSGLFLAAALTLPTATFFAQSAAVELANLREDVRLLTQRMGELQLRLEQLETENNALRAQNAGAAQSYATLAQLNEVIADLNRAMKAGDAATKADTLRHTSAQLEQFAARTNAELEALARNTGPRGGGGSTPVFSDDFPKEGVPHVVQKGDSLASIARKYGARQPDIINANRIVDPSKIQVGQTLFIPGGK